MENYEFREEVKAKIKEFEDIDRRAKEEFEEFADTHVEEIKSIETAVDIRNGLLVETERMLRAEALVIPRSAPRTLKIGPFSVTRKEERSYDEPVLTDTLVRSGLYQQALDYGAIKEIKQVVIDYDRMTDFLRASNMAGLIGTLGSVKVLTPAVSGPKAMRFFSEERKK